MSSLTGPVKAKATSHTKQLLLVRIYKTARQGGREGGREDKGTSPSPSKEGEDFRVHSSATQHRQEDAMKAPRPAKANREARKRVI